MVEPTCTFTASLSCLQCRIGVLASWRADDEFAEAAAKVFQNFRAIHITHPGYREGLPGIGVHAPRDITMPPGSTVLTHAQCQPDPNAPGNLQFFNAQAAIYHTT